MSKVEDYIRENTKHFSNEWYDDLSQGHEPWLTPYQARKAVEIAREEESEYVKYQLELRLPETLDYNGIKVERKDFIEDFIKAIKDD